jgi:hypothetical protein
MVCKITGTAKLISSIGDGILKHLLCLKRDEKDVHEAHTIRKAAPFESNLLSWRYALRQVAIQEKIVNTDRQ